MGVQTFSGPPSRHGTTSCVPLEKSLHIKLYYSPLQTFSCRSNPITPPLKDGDADDHDEASKRRKRRNLKSAESECGGRNDEIMLRSFFSSNQKRCV